MKICAVVVTYNRLELLKLTIDKLLKQSRAVDEIIIINNSSTDGTEEYLSKMINNKINVVNLEKNLGGSGGFYEGIKKSFEKHYDYLWIMDDDTLCTETALEELINGINKANDNEIGFVCSNVLFKDKKPCLMNLPVLCNEWNEKADKGLIQLKATSFVSVLISTKAIKQIGLPIKEFFIWGDDYEYTCRISSKYNCYFVTNSIVYHYMNENKGIDILTTEKNRVNRYYYEFRNKYYIHKKNGKKEKFNYYKYLIKTIIKIIVKKNDYKLSKLKVVIKGYIDGIKFKPEIEYINNY